MTGDYTSRVHTFTHHMKNLLLLLLLVALSIACQKDDGIGPSELLYQRWSIVKTRTINDTIWAVNDVVDASDVEYRPDGTLIYRRNGQLTNANCCAPIQYSRINGEIQYTKWDVCPYAYCSFRRMDKIIQLNNDLLELNDGYHITQYNSVK